MTSAGLAVESPGTSEPEVAPFAWPAPLELLRRPESTLPNAMGYLEWPDSRAEFVTDVYRRCVNDRLADIGDALLMWPELLFDGVFSGFGSLCGGATLRTWEEEEGRSVMARTFDIQFGPRPQRISAAFLQQWAERERKYLGALDESRAYTYEFEDGTEDADLGELVIDQRKVFWAALRRTYFTRYKMQFDEQVPSKAWALGRWSGIDFVMLPPLMVGYLYYRGLDQKISMGETALGISFEPVSELVERNRDRSVAAALEWTIKGFPVGIIVSVGLQEGRYGMDFVGIGTSLGAVRTAVESQHQVMRR